MKLQIKIKPNSKHREGLEVMEDGTHVLYMKQPAAEGKANMAAIAVLAKHFGVSKSAVQLLSGATSRYKTFEISL